jgi:hypothetical protein
MLVLIRVPVDSYSPLKPAQALRLALQLGDEVSFGRGRDCTVRTDGPGTQATLVVGQRGEMVLTFLGTMPAPGARTTKLAPHGLRVVTHRPDEFRDGKLWSRNSTMVQVTDTHALQVGEVIVFTLHAAKRACFTVAKSTPADVASASNREAEAGAAPAAKRQATASVVPGFNARRIFLRDGGGDAAAGQTADSAALDFSRCAAAARPSPAKLLALATKVGAGELVSLNLANNELSTEAVLALAHGLAQTSCALKGLNLRGNWSTMEDDEVVPQTGIVSQSSRFASVGPLFFARLSITSYYT